MAKIDIMFQRTQSQEIRVLDIYQYEMLSLYEKLINEKNVIKYLGALGSQGYIMGIELKDGKYRVYCCDDEYIQNFSSRYGKDLSIHSEFDVAVVFFSKKLLRDWHNKRSTRLADPKRFWDKGEIVYTELTHKQRGILTKILKIDRRRKKFLGPLSGV